MKFKLAVLAVEDVNRSKQFYSELFDQTVALDLGKNVTFNSGFGVQEDFAWLTSLNKDSVIKKAHNMELYFEVDDFDDFLQRLCAYNPLEYVHPPMKHDWQQRVVRIYDPDGHVIEIGESMEVIARRYLHQGFSIQETAEIIQHPLDFVVTCTEDGGN